MGRRKEGTLGRAIVRKQFSGAERRGNRVHGAGSEHKFRHVTSSEEGRLASVTDANDIDELMATVTMSGREFAVEHERAVVLDKRVYRSHVTDLPPQHRLGVLAVAAGDEVGASLPIPLRPAWTRSMSADELHARERDSFLDWRRSLVKVEEERGVLLTPYEKNLEVWRQLWRVVERSDVVLQIVDARNPLLFYCPAVDEYARRTPRNMKKIASTSLGEKDAEPKTQTLLLINKSDFLSPIQRQLWYNYLQQRGISFVFFSAAIAAEKEEELAREASIAKAQEEIKRCEMEASRLQLTNDSSSVTSVVANPSSAKEEKTTSSSDPSDTATFDTAQSASLAEMTKEKEEDKKKVALKKEEKANADVDAGSLGKLPIHEHEIRILSRDELVALLLERYGGANTDRKVDGKSQLMVGMVGYPNVGKSSTINVLFGSKKTTVSSTPGKTKHFQTLRVELSEEHHPSTQELWLCDCPGLVFPSVVSTKAHMVVNGLLPVDTLRDYRGPISLLCQRIPRWMWLDSYGLRLPPPPDHLPADSPPDVEVLLQTYGMLRGFMNAHGAADVGRAARTLLKDYVDGIKLLYCAPPPPPTSDKEGDDAQITPELCVQRAADYNLLGIRQEATASKLTARGRALPAAQNRKLAGLDDFLQQEAVRAHRTKLRGAAAAAGRGRGGMVLNNQGIRTKPSYGKKPPKRANRRGRGRKKRWD